MTDGPASFPALSAPVHKQRLSKPLRLLRLIQGVVDPRVWAHMLKVANQYNYGHVAQLRELRRGPGAEISPNATLRNAHNITAGAKLHLGGELAVRRRSPVTTYSATTRAWAARLHHRRAPVQLGLVVRCDE